LQEIAKVNLNLTRPKDLVLKYAALGLALMLGLSGCTGIEETSAGACDGVRVDVNFGSIAADQISSCIAFEGNEILAKEALAQAGVELEGTATYPDQIVCRVNGLPSATEALEIEGQEPHFESCADMPPEFAYWALWVKSDDSSPWEYATEGAATLKLSRGQAVGLAFASGDEAPTPTN
jgi:hypothetical protein